MVDPAATERTKASRISYAALVSGAALIIMPFTLAAIQGSAAAARWWPFSSDAKAGLASDLLAADLQDRQTHNRAASLAIDALRLSPINAAAARSLGLAAAAEGKEAEAGRAFDYALRLSRRDLPTHLWFIEHAVGRGDIPSALTHYDQAMRTSLASRKTLIPVLIGAAGERDVANALIPLLRRKPNWWGEFVHLLIGTAQDPQIPYHFVRALGLSTADPDHPDFLPRTIDRLVAAGRFDLAFDLYAHNAGTGGRQLLRNGDFERVDMLPPLDWRYAEDPDLSALRQSRPDGKGNALFLAARSGRGGVVAEQVLNLSPGRYRLSLLVGSVTAGNAGERPGVMLNCAKTESRQVLNVRLPQSPENGRRATVEFAIPSTCDAQRLSIEARAPFSGNSDMLPWIDEIVIRRVNG